MLQAAWRAKEQKQKSKLVHPPGESESSVTGNMWADLSGSAFLEPDHLQHQLHPSASHARSLTQRPPNQPCKSSTPGWGGAEDAEGLGPSQDGFWASLLKRRGQRAVWGSPWVPFHLLLVAEAQEARADVRGHPRAAFMKEPLEDEETGHRDGEDELAEWVHGHPPLLWKDGRNETDKLWLHGDQVSPLIAFCSQYLSSSYFAFTSIVNNCGWR